MSGTNPQALNPLDWFPKEFTPGDMDAAGGERLLGRTELSRLEVLIRETAQNSWDARRDGIGPIYGINLRRADFQLRGDLQRLLPGQKRVSPVGAQAFDSPFALEIFDRGTSGLNGPVTLRPVARTAPRNFQNLILKVGVPRDDGKGGGTYGFGKTASYAFSRQGTVIYWTRCRDESGHLEHRLIASAFRESYADGGVQYTGRHWWGSRDGDVMMPVQGEAASRLGERLFERGFLEDETGTSMLIIEPDLSRESLGLGESIGGAETTPDPAVVSREFADCARKAIRAHLWPKLTPEPHSTSCPMAISLTVNAKPVPLVGDQPGVFALWGAGLNAIRSYRNGSSEPFATPGGLPVSVDAITRRGKTLGHVAVVKRVLALEPRNAGDDLDPTSTEGAVHRIALMRGQTELIVTTTDWVTSTPIEGFDWLAVYKAEDEFDASYARTEPPAHDAWIPSAGGEEGLIVRATRLRVIKVITDSLFPEPTAPVETRQRTRTGALAKRFGFMLPVADEKAPGVGPRAEGGKRRGGAAPRPIRLDVAAPRLITTLPDGRQRQRVEFIAPSSGADTVVSIFVSAIGDEGAQQNIPSGALDVQWNDARALNQRQALIKAGDRASVEFTAPGRRALRIELTAGSAP